MSGVPAMRPATSGTRTRTATPAAPSRDTSAGTNALPRRRSRDGGQHAEAAAIYRTVGIPVIEGITAFHRGAYDQAVAALLPVRVGLWRIGGSHAQRDVVDWTLTEAFVRQRSAPNRRFLRHAEAIAA